jgi:hypothetical protein
VHPCDFTVKGTGEEWKISSPQGAYTLVEDIFNNKIKINLKTCKLRRNKADQKG